MSRLVVFSLAVCTGLLTAEEDPLDLMRSQLLRMRPGQTYGMKARGASPALTTVKHELIAKSNATSKTHWVAWTRSSSTARVQTCWSSEPP
jgi:hypothetical protein